MRVLIVDDDRDTADSLQVLVRAWGHSAWVAYDGPTALEAVGRVRPDVVLLDLKLPGLDGFAVARAIRQQPDLDAVLIVAITGHAGADRQQLAAAGIQRCLLKPVDPDLLQSWLSVKAAMSKEVYALPPREGPDPGAP